MRGIIGRTSGLVLDGRKITDFSLFQANNNQKSAIFYLLNRIFIKIKSARPVTGALYAITPKKMFLIFKIFIASLLLFVHWKLYTLNEKKLSVKTLIIAFISLIPISVITFVIFKLLTPLTLPKFVSQDEANHLTGNFTLLTFTVFFAYLFRVSFNKFSSGYLSLFSKKNSERRILMDKQKNKLDGIGNFTSKLGIPFIIMMVLFKALPNSYSATLKSDTKAEQLPLILKEDSENVDKILKLVSLIKASSKVDSLTSIEKNILLLDSVTSKIYSDGLIYYCNNTSKEEIEAFKKTLLQIGAIKTLNLIESVSPLIYETDSIIENRNDEFYETMDYNDSLIIRYASEHLLKERI